MAHWVTFSADYDHKWPSGAVTAFKEGMTVYVKSEVVKAAKGVGAAKEVEKPKDGEPYLPTPRRDEGERFKPGHRTVAAVKRGGHGFDKSGNPIAPSGLPKAPADDPAAIRSEPLIERDRQRVAGVEADKVEDLESASQIEAAPPTGNEGGDGEQ